MKNLTVEAWIEKNFAQGSEPPKDTVWRWIREGRLPATRLGRRYYIPPDATINPTSDAAARILN